MLVTLLLLFTKQTNFNLSGVQYQFNQETMTMTIEKGVLDKQVVEKQVTSQDALDVMLQINEADQLWKMNIYLISLFAAVFIALFFTPLRPKKYYKWYVFMYFIFLVTFVIWDVTVHKELAGKLAVTLKGL
ncbi:hypothetical protein SAMD00020551_4883 [Mesobacillus selenatarsenatis SF-1]|uniref:Uncharacterized protein n=1 Tax=Mesobacillus selenatarsenatis (strain DSM 18680 / JCM 14380 / FERM P-15431 / SF-1) TaxID=1321606 RepID=A0A0A8X9N8_MESS1|nr:hypothetical protein SAMD00020551_4883 [Mesobacillus selenatarsenatis SF-1]